MPTHSERRKETAIARWVDNTNQQTPSDPFRPLPSIPDSPSSPDHQTNAYASAFYKNGVGQASSDSGKSDVSSASTIKPHRRMSIATARTRDSVATQYTPTAYPDSVYEPTKKSRHHHRQHTQQTMPIVRAGHVPWPGGHPGNGYLPPEVQWVNHISPHLPGMPGPPSFPPNQTGWGGYAPMPALPVTSFPQPVMPWQQPQPFERHSRTREEGKVRHHLRRKY